MTDNRTSNTLLPCPFCGGSARMATEHDSDSMTWHYITCRGCGARSRGNWHSPGNDCPLHREEVRDEWNRRAPSEPPVEQPSATEIIRQMKGRAADSEGGTTIEVLLSDLRSVVTGMLARGSEPPAESLTIIADLLATIDQVADKWKLTDHGCTSCVPGLEGDWLCARHRAVSYVDRNTVTKSVGTGKLCAIHMHAGQQGCPACESSGLYTAVETAVRKADSDLADVIRAAGETSASRCQYCLAPAIAGGCGWPTCPHKSTAPSETEQ